MGENKHWLNPDSPSRHGSFTACRWSDASPLPPREIKPHPAVSRHDIVVRSDASVGKVVACSPGLVQRHIVVSEVAGFCLASVSFDQQLYRFKTLISIQYQGAHEVINIFLIYRSADNIRWLAIYLIQFSFDKKKVASSSLSTSRAPIAPETLKMDS